MLIYLFAGSMVKQKVFSPEFWILLVFCAILVWFAWKMVKIMRSPLGDSSVRVTAEFPVGEFALRRLLGAGREWRYVPTTKGFVKSTPLGFSDRLSQQVEISRILAL
jgi:hypothetical protein